MYIVSMAGSILASFNQWDIRSVGQAERWITDNHYVIWKCEIINGLYYVIVKENK